MYEESNESNTKIVSLILPVVHAAQVDAIEPAAVATRNQKENYFKNAFRSIFFAQIKISNQKKPMLSFAKKLKLKSYKPVVVELAIVVELHSVAEVDSLAELRELDPEELQHHFAMVMVAKTQIQIEF